MTAVLVRHPRGDLLIDTGLGREIESQLQLMPLVFRAVSKLERGRSASEQLDAAGYDRKRLRGILLTHAHWDHVSGVQDFADVPVLVTAEERRFVEAAGWITAFAKSIPPVRYEEYGFEAGPYLGFDLEPRRRRRRLGCRGSGAGSHAGIGDRLRHAAEREPVCVRR